MNDITAFQQMLKLRRLFHRISQVSWDIDKLEKQYPLDLLSDGGLEQLRSAYIDEIEEARAAVRELEAYGQE